MLRSVLFLALIGLAFCSSGAPRYARSHPLNCPSADMCVTTVESPRPGECLHHNLPLVNSLGPAHYLISFLHALLGSSMIEPTWFTSSASISITVLPTPPSQSVQSPSPADTPPTPVWFSYLAVLMDSFRSHHSASYHPTESAILPFSLSLFLPGLNPKGASCALLRENGWVELQWPHCQFPRWDKGTHLDDGYLAFKTGGGLPWRMASIFVCTSEEGFYSNRQLQINISATTTWFVWLLAPVALAAWVVLFTCFVVLVWHQFQLRINEWERLKTIDEIANLKRQSKKNDDEKKQHHENNNKQTQQHHHLPKHEDGVAAATAGGGGLRVRTGVARESQPHASASSSTRSASGNNLVSHSASRSSTSSTASAPSGAGIGTPTKRRKQGSKDGSDEDADEGGDAKMHDENDKTIVSPSQPKRGRATHH